MLARLCQSLAHTASPAPTARGALRAWSYHRRHAATMLCRSRSPCDRRSATIRDDVDRHERPGRRRRLETIRSGDVEALREQLLVRPELSGVRIRDRKGCGRTLLHVATDWPGHFPRVAETISVLVDAGADVDAPFEGATPRRRCTGRRAATTWRRSTRCSTRAPTSRRRGSVIGGGTPLADAVAFGQWQPPAGWSSAAPAELWHAAALGLIDRVRGSSPRARRRSR